MLKLHHVTSRTRKSVLLAGTVILLLTGQILAGDKTFNVDSYIPEKVTDTQWRLDGGFRLNGLERQYDDISTRSGLISRNEYDYDERYVNLGCLSSYRYETVPKYLHLGLVLRGEHSKYTISSSRWTDSDQFNGTEGSGYIFAPDEEFAEERKDYVTSVTPFLDVGVYVRGDGFFSIIGHADLIYQEYESDYRTLFVAGSDTNESSGNYLGDYKSQRISIALLPGSGRVYEGWFASTAMYVLDELRKKNLVAREPTFDEMLDLTEIIYQYRLKHAVDYRLHKIEATEAIAEYLVSHGIVVDTKSPALLLIEDVWTYFPRFSRRFGWMIRTGLGYSYEHESRQQTSTRHRHSSFSLSAPHVIVKMDYHKSVNHRWQVDINGEARYYLGAEASGAGYLSGEQEDDYENFYNFDCSALARHILSSRTYLTLSGSFGYGHLDREMTRSSLYCFAGGPCTWRDTTFAGPSFDDWHYSIGLSLTYRISIPVELIVTGAYRSGPHVRNSIGVEQGDSGSFVLYYMLWPTASYSIYNKTGLEVYELSAQMSYYLF